MADHFRFSRRSLRSLEAVNPRLVRVAQTALRLSDVDFVVTEGRRSLARQQALVKAGASRTLRSKHLTGDAIDVAAIVDGQIRWDWPLYGRIAEAFKEAARLEGVEITWGGDWPRFRDGPHFEVKT